MLALLLSVIVVGILQYSGMMKAYNGPTNVGIMTLFMNIGAMLTPIAQPQIYIGVDLADDDMTLEKYVKCAFVPIWAMSLI